MANEAALADHSRTTWDDRILAIRVGMGVAEHIVRQAGGWRYADLIANYERTWSTKVERNLRPQSGSRPMVAHDIYLKMPLMDAADIGWPG